MIAAAIVDHQERPEEHEGHEQEEHVGRVQDRTGIEEERATRLVRRIEGATLSHATVASR